jgi:hypothetical protein
VGRQPLHRRSGRRRPARRGRFRQQRRSGRMHAFAGDSGGPGFVRTGSGWKVATVNYAVGPDSFTLSTNPASSFNASLYDCAGLYYDDGETWCYVPPEDSPAPCLMYNTRTSKRLAWLTNAVSGLVFPADIGLSWRCETNAPTARQAEEGIWFELTASNAGPIRRGTWRSSARGRSASGSAAGRPRRGLSKRTAGRSRRSRTAARSRCASMPSFGVRRAVGVPTARG